MAEVTSETTEVKTPKKKGEESSPVTKKEHKLTDLKVADLRTELENRGLDKTGVKAALVERLRKALEEEGKNVDEYCFDVASTETPTAKKSKRIEKSLNDSKSGDTENVENDSEDNEEEETRAADEGSVTENGEVGEIIELSLDDKESSLEVKENLESQDKSSEDNEVAEESEVAATDEASEGEKNGTAMEDNEEEEEEEVEEKSEAVVTEAKSEESKPKVVSKTPVKVVPQEEPPKDAKNIWITGLSSATRAADLKTLFNKQGKVVSVKIVTNAKQVSGEKKYYGFITMNANKDALKAVENLNNTKLNDQTICLELTDHQPGTLLKKASSKPGVKKVKAVGETAKATVAQKAKRDAEPKEDKSETEEKDEKAPRRDRDRERRSREPRDYRSEYRGSYRRPFGGYRGRGRGRGAPGGYNSYRGERPPMETFRRPYGRRPFGRVMTYRPPMKPRFMSYSKMREDRMSHDRYRDREMRESERRREEDYHHKMVERKQREEAYRLEREKVQLRIEREMLERERAEILKLEREKQRIERERLEREKEKLRQQTRMRESAKRPFPGPPSDSDMWEKEKRARYHESGGSSGGSTSRYQSYPSKPRMESRPEYREPPPVYNPHKFEQRPEHYERESRSMAVPRTDFKYTKEKPETSMRDHDERRVYKRNFYKEDTSRGGYPTREPERYPPPRDDRFKPKVHETMRSPRSRGGGGRRMSYY